MKSILWKSTRVQNLCDTFLFFLYLLIKFFFFFAFFSFIFYLFFTITVTANPYPQLVSGSRIRLGGFWTGGFWTQVDFECRWILNVSHFLHYSSLSVAVEYSIEMYIGFTNMLITINNKFKIHKIKKNI